MTVVSIISVSIVAIACGFIPAYRPLIDTALGRLVLAVAMTSAVIGSAPVWLFILGCGAFLLGLRMGLAVPTRYDFSFLPAFIDARRGAYRMRFGVACV